MDTLTLARYYCELSLMEMEMVTERGSLLASACLLMALLNKDLGGWVSLSLICFFSVVMTPKVSLNLEVLTLSRGFFFRRIRHMGSREQLTLNENGALRLDGRGDGIVFPSHQEEEGKKKQPSLTANKQMLTQFSRNE